LLWSGAPRQGILFSQVDVVLIPFTAVWAGLAVLWEGSALRDPSAGLFVLWGLPFVIVGLYIAVGRFYVDRARRRRITYALTSQRIVVCHDDKKRSVPLATLPEMTLKEMRDGSGTILFGPATFPIVIVAGAFRPGINGPLLFEQIPSVRRVYEQIRAAQQQESKA
jgi:hypothetical protein